MMEILCTVPVLLCPLFVFPQRGTFGEQVALSVVASNLMTRRCKS